MMSLAPVLMRLARHAGRLPWPALPPRWRRFGADRRAVAAVEFALILPVLATMYVGTVEVTQAVTANRKVVATASAIGDLAAQLQDIDAEVANIFAASAATMQPFPTGTLQMRMTQVMIDGQSRVTVGWSFGSGMTALTRGATFSTLPEGLRIANTAVILAEVRYSYTSPIGNLFIGSMNMAEEFWLRPRIGSCVRSNNSCS